MREERAELALAAAGDAGAAAIPLSTRTFYAAMAQMVVDRPMRLSVTPEVKLFMQVAYLSQHPVVGADQAAQRLTLRSIEGNRVTLLRHVEAGAAGKAQAFVSDEHKLLVIGCAPRGTSADDIFRAQ